MIHSLTTAVLVNENFQYFIHFLNAFVSFSFHFLIYANAVFLSQLTSVDIIAR